VTCASPHVQPNGKSLLPGGGQIRPDGRRRSAPWPWVPAALESIPNSSCTTRRASTLCCFFLFLHDQRQKRRRRLTHAASAESWIGFAERVIRPWMQQQSSTHTFSHRSCQGSTACNRTIRGFAARCRPLVEPPATDGAPGCDEELRLTHCPSSGSASGGSFASRRSPL